MMNPEGKSASSKVPLRVVETGGENPLVCDPWENRDVDLLKIQSAFDEGNTYIGGGTNTPTWREDGTSHLSDRVSLRSCLADKFPGIGARGSISIDEIRAQLWTTKRLGHSLRWAEELHSLIARGNITVTGAGASTGMTVLRGGLTSA